MVRKPQSDLDAGTTEALNRLRIRGIFSKKDLNVGNFGQKNNKRRSAQPQTFEILKPKSFEKVELPDDEGWAKLAYDRIYRGDISDFDIECQQIKRYEKLLKLANSEERKSLKKSLKSHYTRAVYLLAPHIAAGWNRWSDNILDLFLSQKMHHVLWGSGNCGKSQVMAVLLYIKWRVNPAERMIVIASRVMTESKERVIGYIKQIHVQAPTSPYHTFDIVDTNSEKGIYTMMRDKGTGKLIRNEQGCIVALPIKIKAETRELGQNLKGKHPKDLLVIAFDEAQELPGDIVDMEIFSNWYANANTEIHAWGNPGVVHYFERDTWDILFRLGAGRDTVEELKRREEEAHYTSSWSTKNTRVLHLSMLDSPKDDPEEVENYITDTNGTSQLRLWFLAGKKNAQLIQENITPHSPSWYAQVLGFPYINLKGNSDRTLLTPDMVRESRTYPLQWVDSARNQFYLSCDPSLGDGDACSIVCGSKGMMRDGRDGVDIHNGKYCEHVRKVEGEDFVDTVINRMYHYSKLLKIPLNRITIEIHGVGEVFRYAMLRHIESKDGVHIKPIWAKQWQDGQRYVVNNPTKKVSDRLLFRTLGRLEPAKDVVLSWRTETNFAVRCGVLSRQIFNMPESMCQQYYSQQFVKTGNDSKYKLETKEDLKERGLPSPNDADAMSGLFDLMRLRGFKLKFANRFAYKDKYGAEYQSYFDRRVAEKAFGIVSSALNLEFNLLDSVQLREVSEDRTGKKVKKRNIYAHQIPAV